MGKQLIQGWDGLRPWGFLSLGSGTCGIGTRTLVDLTPQGLENLEHFLSVDIQPGNNWNSSSGEVASALLPASMWRDLAVYLLLSDGAQVAVAVRWYTDYASADWVQPMTEGTWKIEEPKLREIFGNCVRDYRAEGNACDGTRNRHYWLGRTE